MRRFPPLCGVVCLLTPLLLAGLASAQETENLTPPPVLFAVPHFSLHTPDGSTRLLGGVDAALAMPLTLRSNLTASHFFNARGSNSSSALFNYDTPLGDDTILRGLVGLIDDDFGYGITAHRSLKYLGVGAYVQSVDSDWQAGLMLTTPIQWGVKLRRVRQPTADTRWYSSAGSVARLGACAALEYRDLDQGYQLSTRTAFFPRYDEHSWPRGGADAQSASATGVDFSPPAHLVWSYKAEGPIRTGPAVLDGVAYVASHDEWLYAVDIRNGERLWRFPANSPIISAPAVSSGHIYFGTQAGELFCIKAPVNGEVPAGHLVWRFKANAPITGSPLVTDAGLVFFGSGDGTFYAVETGSGRLRWLRKTDGAILAGASKGLYPIPAGLDENIKATGRAGAILCTSTDGKVYAFAESTGELVWSVDTGAPVTAAPAIYRTTVYVGNYAGKVWGLSIAGGQILWDANLSAPVVAAPAITPSVVCIATRNGHVFGLSAKDGSELWQTALPAAVSSSPTIVAGGKLYVTCHDGYVRALDLDSGEPLWEHFAGEPLTTGATIAEGHMLIGGENAGLYAYRRGPGKSVQIAYASQEPFAVGPAGFPAPTRPRPDTTQPPSTSVGPPTQVSTPTLPVTFPRPTHGTRPSRPSVAPGEVHTTSPGSYPPQLPAPAPAAGQRTTATDRRLAGKPGTEQPPAALVDDELLHMTLLTEPAAGDTPLLVSNRDYVFIGGTIADPSTVAAIQVNGKPVTIEDNRFMHREQFPGPGEYLLRVTATSTQGAASERVRRVRVISPSDPQVPQEVRIAARPAPDADCVTFTLGLGGKIPRQHIIAEIQETTGRVLQRWTHSGAGPFRITWDGMSLADEALPPGDYMAVFALVVGDQMLARIRQPLILDY